MASSGTPNEGRDRISDKVYDANTLLALYTNLAGSLDENTVFADLVEPTGTGYARASMSGDWNETDGVVTYDHGTPDDVEFFNSNAIGGANWSLPVTGAALLDVRSGVTSILHFVDAPNAVTMTPQKRLRIDVSNLIAP